MAATPMLGRVGLAQAGDFAPTSGPAGPYEGNLDYYEIDEGATKERCVPARHLGPRGRSLPANPDRIERLLQ